MPWILIAATALQQAQASAKETIYPSQLDLSVPASAALDILGVSTSKAKSPTSLQEMVGYLVNSFDANGLPKNGFALNTAVYRFNRFDVDRLTNNPVDRALFLTNLSAAYVVGNGDDRSGRGALSVSIPLIDRTDWRTDRGARNEWDAIVVKALGPKTLALFTDMQFARESAEGRRNALYRILPSLKDEAPLKKLVEDAIKAIDDNVAQIPENTLIKDLTVPVKTGPWKAISDAYTAVYNRRIDIGLAVKANEADPKLEDLVKAFDQKRWNARKIDVAGAWAFFSPDPKTSDLKGEGTYVWLSWAEPIASGQFTGFVRYAENDRTWDTTGKSWNLTNRRQFGGRYRVGSDRVGAYIEYLQSSDDVAGKPTEISQLWQGGYETRISQGQWLQLSLGKGNGFFSKNLFGLSFNFSFSTTRGIDSKGNTIKPKT